MLGDDLNGYVSKHMQGYRVYVHGRCRYIVQNTGERKLEYGFSVGLVMCNTMFTERK